MTGSEQLKNCSPCGVFPVCSGQYLSKVVQGRNSGEPATGSWVAKANWCIAEEVNAGSDRKVSKYTVHRRLFCIWGCMAVDQSGCPCWPRPPLKSPIMSMWASELDHWAMEEDGLVWWIPFSFKSCGWLGAFALLTWEEHMAPGCNMGRWLADGDSLMLLAMFCLETLGPAIHVDVTWHLPHSIVADHIYPLMETVFPDGCGLFHQDNAPYHKEKLFRSTTTSLRCWLRIQIPQISIQSSICGMCWTNKFRSMEAPPRNSQDLMDLLLTSWCQIPQHTLRGLVEWMPWWDSSVLAAKGGPTLY